MSVSVLQYIYLSSCWGELFATQTIVWEYTIIHQSVMWKDWVAMFIVTVKFQNITECLSILCPYHWSLCNRRDIEGVSVVTANQTKCKQSGRIWTVTLWFTASLACRRGYLAVHDNKACFYQVKLWVQAEVLTHAHTYADVQSTVLHHIVWIRKRLDHLQNFNQMQSQLYLHRPWTQLSEISIAAGTQNYWYCCTSVAKGCESEAANGKTETTSNTLPLLLGPLHWRCYCVHV